MKPKIVLVRPLYEENVGLVARAMANFSCKELALVKPKCNWLSVKAKSRAMHGKGILLKAKSFDSIGEAVKGCTYSIATSAKQGKGLRKLDIGEAVERLGKSRAKIAIVFGPEPSGLTKKEIAECDFVAGIPASKGYPTLNLSHAVCLVLYLFFSAGKQGVPFKEAGSASKKAILRKFDEILEILPGIDDRAFVRASFKALGSRSLLSEREAKALIAFFNEAGKGLKQKG